MEDLKEHDGLNEQPNHGYLQDTPPRADVDEILRRKRKAREYKVGRLIVVGVMFGEEL